jgi:hypothetical protein
MLLQLAEADLALSETLETLELVAVWGGKTILL